jgi:nitroreductase
MTVMHFQDVVAGRRMVRSFDPQPLPAEVVDRIVANALRGPSAGFTQATELLVLEGAAETERFWNASFASDEARDRFRWPGLFQAPLLVVAFANGDAYRRRYGEPDKARARRTWPGPEDAGAGPAPVPYWFVDAGFAAMLMLLTAVDAGVGALFFVVADPDHVRATFGVPDGFEPVGALAVGYPAADDRPSGSVERRRRSADEVVHRGRW